MHQNLNTALWNVPGTTITCEAKAIAAASEPVSGGRRRLQMRLGIETAGAPKTDVLIGA